MKCLVAGTVSFKNVWLNSITDRLREAGKLIGIELVDHVIVTNGGYLSICG